MEIGGRSATAVIFVLILDLDEDLMIQLIIAVEESTQKIGRKASG